MSLLNITKTAVRNLKASVSESHSDQGKCLEMTNITERLLTNSYSDSDSTRVALLGLQNELIYKTLCRIESALLTKYESSEIYEGFHATSTEIDQERTDRLSYN